MQPPTAPCNGYWYNVNLKTPTAGPAWKCITQAEYDVVMAQRAQEDKQGTMAVILIGIVFGSLALILLGKLVVDKLKRKQQTVNINQLKKAKV